MAILCKADFLAEDDTQSGCHFFHPPLPLHTSASVAWASQPDLSIAPFPLSMSYTWHGSHSGLL